MDVSAVLGVLWIAEGVGCQEDVLQEVGWHWVK